MSSSTKSTLEFLTIILEDESAFNEVVDRVFGDLDTNQNQALEAHEFELYLARCCTAFGIKELPGQEQIKQVFRHIDLDNDSAVTKEELSVFLRHLFKEQVKQSLEVKRKPKEPVPASGTSHG